MKTPKTVWLLFAYFASCVVGAAATLFTYETRADFRLFREAGLEPLFFVMTITLLVLCGATVQLIWSPRPSAVRIGIITIGALVAAEAIASIIALANADAFREILKSDLLAGGGDAEMAEQTADLALSPAILVFSFLLTAAGAWLGTWLFVSNRDYFDHAHDAEASAA
jgi:hypothetical protein